MNIVGTSSFRLDADRLARDRAVQLFLQLLLGFTRQRPSSLSLRRDVSVADGPRRGIVRLG